MAKTREVLPTIESLHEQYLKDDGIDVPRPRLELTEQQVFQLRDEVTIASALHNKISALAYGWGDEELFIDSVIITKRKVEDNG